ncbi:uncharacterized protein LOC114828435 [Galendromus occidentalis]|uniref:Uncharacterized protein LOC114828435 n=1 Tax=Galendromus occidentalis TaxID=34638 RepID=A0AAJ7SGV3_9ACAR|nr:uncharacterized protein LOC114828435 [Galendromus occidentalis]
MRFRTQSITLLADIEKSFPQIIIEEKDRDALRFLWDLDNSGHPRTFRLTRNYFGFASSSFILAACIQTLIKWHEPAYPETARLIRENHYVDDVATGAANEKEAMEIYKQTKEIFAHGSFNLRKWSSNSAALTEMFRHNGDGIEQYDSSSWCRVLGMNYNQSADTMKLIVTNASTNLEIVTKRTVLSIVASVFDRMGIVAPLLVPAKVLMQKLWTLKISWDDPVPEDVNRDFRKWIEDLKRIESVTIPRRYWEGGNPSEKTLHVFADASQHAYGFCAYIVSSMGTSRTSTLMLAKSRVAPLRNATIPRLELMALTLAAEALSYIRTQCRIECEEEHLWTDNSGVFFQATSEYPEKLPTFARNRVQKIRQLAGRATIHHVPGQLNPADLVSRGCTFSEFERSCWLSGPDFIRKPKSMWPKPPGEYQSEPLQATEAKELSEFKSFLIRRPEQPEEVAVNLVVDTQSTLQNEPVLRFDSCSRWNLYLRAVVRFRRTVDYWRKRGDKEQLQSPILQEELERAETFIVSQVQAASYGQEIRHITAGLNLPKTSPIRVFAPFLKDGLLCLGGRLESNVGELPKHPVILPPKHPVTRMILRDVHERSCHAGPTHVIVATRHKYWIPQGKRIVRNIIHSCKNCRAFHLRPASATVGPPPEARVSKSQPFEHVGTDVLGPLMVKQGNEQKKVWVILYTCCAMRAVHLEIIQSLSTVELMMSLRRFKARRGCPRTFYSDNAKAYQRAAEDLKALCELMKNTNIQEQLATEGIEWKFSIERAPWYMGFTERLVGSVKSALKKVLGKTVVTEQELLTVLCEVESMINRRPLCDVPESEHIDVLTPMHFLVNRTEDPVQESIAPNKIRAQDLLKRWRHKKLIVESIWKRWEHEYLLLLREFHEKVPKDLSTITVGQVVIIKDPKTPKLFWRLGRVEKLNFSRDKVIRSCLLRLGNGRMTQRALKYLYPLEVV